MHSERAGVVLAGGSSERFGETDKALAEFHGVPMIEHVVDALEAVTDQVVVNCRSDQLDALRDALASHDVTYAVDPEPDLGPVAGVGTALDHVDAPVLALVACDMPAVDPTFLRYLFDRIGGNEAAVPGFPDGHRQPAMAVYRTEPLREAAADCLATGDGSLHGVLERLQAAVVPPAEVQQITDWHTLTDVNTPAALADLADQVPE